MNKHVCSLSNRPLSLRGYERPTAPFYICRNEELQLLPPATRGYLGGPHLICSGHLWFLRCGGSCGRDALCNGTHRRREEERGWRRSWKEPAGRHSDEEAPLVSTWTTNSVSNTRGQALRSNVPCISELLVILLLVYFVEFILQ